MKRALVVFVAVVALAAFVPQDLGAGVGFKGGLNFATWKYVGPLDLESAFVNLKGPVVGGFFSLGLGPVAIQPEIYYSRRGVRLEEAPAWMEFQLNYVEVPVLVKITVLPGPFGPYLAAGPYGSFLLTAKGLMSDGDLEVSEDIKSDFKSTDYGLVFGGGIEFKLAVVKLIVEGRYTMGMANIVADPGEGESAKNKGFSVLVGIGF